ncbi:hypothetical protein [Pontibacter vulgaris]|uniref:hypothetical protein n=1 Tax=Pontibacter vulgaris TaxID=2905679 RepID=UPI001FA7EFAB|nr:hypothetical protein [Pontibacter vulgaris]
MKKMHKMIGKAALVMAFGAFLTTEASAQATVKSKTTVKTNVGVMQQDTTSIKQWEQNLLGTYAEVNTISALNLRQAYITLLENARAQQNTWTDKDWNKVHAVINKLDARKNALEKQLGADDKAKIKLLQGELRALETKGDVKD